MKHSDSETRVERSRTAVTADDRGVVAVVVAILIPLFLILCGISIDVGRWYVEGQRAQNAADAAAMAGVTWLPQDPTNAFAAARAVAGFNGYPNPDTVEPFIADDASSQLYVTVSSTITNIFGGLFGNPTTTLSRSAVADYSAPAIMGSPCNALGNQPATTAGTRGAGPTGSVVPIEADGGYPACADAAAPGFWLNIAGPVTDKQRGDRYATRTNCSQTVDGCTGGTNDEYREEGYIFVVRVQPDAVNKPVTMQLYDPEFANTGDTCTAAPTASTSQQDTTVNVTRRARSTTTNPDRVTLTTAMPHAFSAGDSVTVSGVGNGMDGTFSIRSVTVTTFTYDSNGTADTGTTVSGTATVTHDVPDDMANPYSGSAVDAAIRYAQDTTSANGNAAQYCPGDATQNAGTYLNTSFVLREQTDSGNPLLADPVGECQAKQYASLRSGSNFTNATAGQLTLGSSNYNAGLARVFHQWVDFCTFHPPRPGDYYLQVRTNVPLVGSTTDSMTYTATPSLITKPSYVDLSGGGHNRFAIRASVPGLVSSGVNVGKPLATQVAVSGWERMPIYANESAVTATFNLIQVLPNAAGGTFTFSTFDNGDAPNGCPGCTVRVKLPVDVYSTNGGTVSLGTCVGSGPVSGNLTNCTVAVSSATNQGRIQTITVPIPADYGCLPQSSGGCWFQVLANYPGGVTDTTTWDATIGGDPVRLIR